MLLSRAVEVFGYRAIADGAVVWKDKLGMMRLVERLGRWRDLSLISGMPMNALTKLLSPSANTKGSCLVSFCVEGGRGRCRWGRRGGRSWYWSSIIFEA
jgi:hypothetical protein